MARHSTATLPAVDPFTLGVIIGLAVLTYFVVVLYNRLIRFRNRTDNAWAQVDVQLRRRYDLIPNLVEVVKGYAAHERQTFEDVTNARAAAIEAGTVEEQGQAENMLTGALRRLFALAEAYPELRASENFRKLQEDIGDTENKIAVARQIYNDATLTFNNAVQTVPSNIVAAIFRFQTLPYFETDGDSRSAPEVRF